MPPKIRKLKAVLRQAAFVDRPGKGSHTVWTHLTLPGLEIVLSGNDGDDAQKYQIMKIRKALKDLGLGGLL